MLENSGSLFNEATTLGWAGRKDVFKFVLPNDHVHLATETRVAQQLLHIEQTAALTVDCILALTAAKQGSRDSYFCVVDRKRAVGVVDG